MRMIKCFSVIITLLVLLSACTHGGNNLDIRLSDPDTNITDLISETYNENQLADIVGFSGTINELDTRYTIECVRKIENGYRVAYCGEFSIGIIIFNNNGKRILGNIYSATQSKSSFNVLSVGQSLENAKIIDPKGDYIFLYTGRNDTPKISTHYTNDGYIIKITYDDKNLITNIETELI